MEWKPLPIGVDNFENLITKGYYFIDKTLFIRDLLDMKGEVNLFTRPRRFGKTLNMSMLRYFFEFGEDNSRIVRRHENHVCRGKIPERYGAVSDHQPFFEVHEAGRLS